MPIIARKNLIIIELMIIQSDILRNIIACILRHRIKIKAEGQLLSDPLIFLRHVYSVTQGAVAFQTPRIFLNHPVQIPDKIYFR